MQAQQPSLDALPDDLLHKVLCAVWDARPASAACTEVRLVLALERVSRRFRRVLRARPLRLRLDFSATRLAARHLEWLARPTWRDRVEALTLYNWLAPAREERSRVFLDPVLCTDGDVLSPLLAVLRANQRASLRRLLGMPLRLGGVAAPPPDDLMDEQVQDALPCTPFVDLSAFRIEHLGVPGGFSDCIIWDMLPRTLVSLTSRAAHAHMCSHYWQASSTASAAMRLPSLASVHLCGGTVVVGPTCFPVLAGWRCDIRADVEVVIHVNPDYDHPDTHGSLFPGAREVCIDARSVVFYHEDEPGPATSGDSIMKVLADTLCAPCLERMEIRSGSEWPSISMLEDPYTTRMVWQRLLEILIGARMSQYAFEISDGSEKWVSWRRLPVEGNPEREDAQWSTLHAMLWTQGSFAGSYRP